MTWTLSSCRNIRTASVHRVAVSFSVIESHPLIMLFVSFNATTTLMGSFQNGSVSIQSLNIAFLFLSLLHYNTWWYHVICIPLRLVFLALPWLVVTKVRMNCCSHVTVLALDYMVTVRCITARLLMTQLSSFCSLSRTPQQPKPSEANTQCFSLLL